MLLPARPGGSSDSGARRVRAEVPRAALGPAKRHEPAPADGENARRPRGRARGRGGRGPSEEAGGAHPRPPIAHQRGESAGRCGLGSELPVLPGFSPTPLAHPPSFRLLWELETQVPAWETPPGILGSTSLWSECHRPPPFLERAGRKHPGSPSRLPSRFGAERWRIGCASSTRQPNLKVSRSVGARVKSREKETRRFLYWEYHLGHMTKSCLPSLGPLRQESGNATAQVCCFQLLLDIP